MTSPPEQALRAQIVETMRQMAARGLNRGASGNASARLGEGLLITPTGVRPEDLTAESIAHISLEGEPLASGGLEPSSEWRMHAGLYGGRGDLGAVVHCHSRYATILACAGKAIPPLHYMTAVSGKPSVPLAPYRLFGSLALAEVVVTAMDGGRACLMANHGLICADKTLAKALAVAEEIEEQAAVYWGTLAIGGPQLLDDGQIAEVMERFKTYGQARSDG